MNNKKKNGQFKKVIGLFGGISLVAGMTIGSGVYYLGSYVLERTNFNYGYAILAWIIGGIISILGGLCFAELGASRPVAGGEVVYLSEAFHPIVGFTNGWSSFLLLASGSTASLAMAVMSQLQSSIGFSGIWIKIGAVAMIVLFTWINLKGVKNSIILQNFTMIVRLVPLFLIIALGLIKGNQPINMSLITEGTPSAEGTGITGIISFTAFATFASLWAYEGWNNLNTVGEEMKNPKRDLPLAIIISLCGITAMYTLFQVAIFKVIPMTDAIEKITAGDIYLGNTVAQQFLGNSGLILVTVCIIVGIVGTFNGGILVFPRQYYVMAKQGFFPKRLANINEKGIPAEATLAASFVSILLVIFNSLQELTSLLTFTSALYNTMCVGAVLIYRKKFKLERPYKVPGGIVTICITLLLFIVMLVNEFISNPKSAIIGLLIPASGILVYLYYKKKNGVEYDSSLCQ